VQLLTIPWMTDEEVDDEIAYAKEAAVD